VRWIKALIMAILVICPSWAWAQCTVSATGVDFGSYNASSGSPTDATGSVTVSCTPSASTTVKLESGLYSGGSFNPRKVSDGLGNYLNYNLYTDASCTIVWGDGTGGTSIQAGGSDVIVYGRIPALQRVKPGTYNDSILITVEW